MDHETLPGQVRMTLQRHWGLILTALALLAALTWGFLPRAVPVDVAKAARAPLRVTVEEEGRTRVIDRYVVSAPVAGYARRIELRVGDAVQQGQMLVALEPLRSEVLDPRSRAAAEARVAAAEAGLQVAEQNARAATSDANIARKEFERRRALAADGRISREERDRAEAAMQHSEAARRSADFAVDVARHELEAARTTLEYAAARASGENPEQVAVHSPIDGRVLSIPRESEGVVAEDQAEMLHKVLEFTNTPVAKVMVPRTEIAWVEEGTTLAKGYGLNGFGHEWAEINGSEYSVVYRLHMPNQLMMGKSGQDLAPVDVPAEFQKTAWVSSMEQYQEMYRRSLDDADAFWAEEADKRLHWFKKWDYVQNHNFAEAKIRWFEGGKLNVTYNCIDRHLPARADQGDGGEKRRAEQGRRRQDDTMIRADDQTDQGRDNDPDEGKRCSEFLPQVQDREIIIQLESCGEEFAGSSYETHARKTQNMSCPAFVVDSSGSVGRITIPFPELKLVDAERFCVLRVLVHFAPVASVQVIPLSFENCAVYFILISKQPAGANIHNALDAISGDLLGDIFPLCIFGHCTRRIGNKSRSAGTGYAHGPADVTNIVCIDEVEVVHIIGHIDGTKSLVVFFNIGFTDRVGLDANGDNTSAG